MELSFVNRKAELKELDEAAATGGLLVFFGRRRVGKTRLLAQWLARHNGLYTQAIESSSELQLEQTYRDLQPQLTTAVTPKSWAEFLEILRLQKKRRWVLCLDEFPYLVNSDPSLPSVLQRWLDHSQPKQSLLLLSGSSTRMMNDLFLNRSAPLYGRARKLVHVRPMSYASFCDACRLNPADSESFTRFSIVGGIPKYWEFVDPKSSALDLAEELFFGFAPYLDQEPARILRDEGISGLNALSLLEAVGRGAEKPSEMAARLGTAQTNLSRLLQQLLDASILERELPFGESVRSTKRTHYRIQDPALRFWFRVYSPHRSRWHGYSIQERQKLLQDHASTVFEDFCRMQFTDATRYWERDLEFDLVRSEGRDEARKKLVVSEVKWKRLTPTERHQIEKQLAATWQRSALRHRHPSVAFEVLDSSILKRIRRKPASRRPVRH
ncbi:MAG: ATP-binding protein [Steroidobacteraceae bacterium]